MKSKEIPEKNEEPVKVVVRKAFDNMGVGVQQERYMHQDCF